MRGAHLGKSSCFIHCGHNATVLMSTQFRNNSNSNHKVAGLGYPSHPPHYHSQVQKPTALGCVSTDTGSKRQLLPTPFLTTAALIRNTRVWTFTTEQSTLLECTNLIVSLMDLCLHRRSTSSWEQDAIPDDRYGTLKIVLTVSSSISTPNIATQTLAQGGWLVE